MVKKIFILTVIILITLTTCKQPIDGNNNTKEQTITIRNESSYVLTNVTFMGLHFEISGTNELPISTQAVQPATSDMINKSGFITFGFKNIPNVICRKDSIVTVTDQNLTLTIYNTDTVVELENENNRELLSRITFSRISIERDRLIVKNDIVPLGETVANYISQHEFTIKNTGKGDLKLTGSEPVKINDSNDVFTVIQPIKSTISPGETLTFKVNFNPKAVQPYSTRITVYSDASNGDFSFTITATGTPPKPIATIYYEGVEYFQNETIYAGEILITQTKNITITVKNEGILLLEIEREEITINGDDAVAFTKTNNPASSISAGGESSFTIEFKPEREGEHNATLRIPTNDTSRNPVIVLLRVNVIMAYTVNFDTNSGIPVPGLQTIVRGEKITEPATMTRTGYTFDGWYKEATFANKWNFANDIVISNTTLYANWIPIPGDLKANNRTTVSITLGWTAVSGASGYNVYRSGSEGGSYSKINASVVTATSYTDAGLLPDTSYYYKLGAIDGDECWQSIPIHTSTLSPIPVNVKATDVTTMSISLAWGIVSGASGYNIYRSNSEAGTYTKINASTITNNSYTDNTVISETIYYYKVCSIIAGSESGLSNFISVAPLSAIPVNLHTTSVTIFTISLAWDIVSGATGYNVYRSASENETYSKVNSSTIVGIVYTDATISPDTNYYYKVTSIVSGVESTLSTSTSATPLVSTPNNVRTTAITENTASLAWDNVNGASGYNVYRSNSETGTYSKVNTVIITGTVFTNVNISPFTETYYYKISSVSNNNMEGIQSNPSIATALVQGRTLAEKLSWLQSYALSSVNYTIEVNDSESIGSQTLSYSGRENVNITLKGIGTERVISIPSMLGTLFTVGSGVTLILDNNITLNGRSGTSGSGSLVLINNGGIFIMNDGKISGNTIISQSKGSGITVSDGTFIMNGGEISGNNNNGGASSSGGVHVDASGTFTMNGGKISDNTGYYGGGVRSFGTFIMYGGEISDNTGSYGGGVYTKGTFTMNGGEICDNTATASGGVESSGIFTMNNGKISRNIETSLVSFSGGGVTVYGIFTMNDGEISGNISGGRGGGVFVYITGTFIMKGGAIASNTVSESFWLDDASVGGGVYIGKDFYMSGGVIYGNNATTELRNTANNGAALYIDNDEVLEGFRNGYIAEYGTFSGDTFIKSGDLTTTNDTIRIVNGEWLTE